MDWVFILKDKDNICPTSSAGTGWQNSFGIGLCSSSGSGIMIKSSLVSQYCFLCNYTFIFFFKGKCSHLVWETHSSYSTISLCSIFTCNCTWDIWHMCMILCYVVKSSHNYLYSSFFNKIVSNQLKSVSGK